MTKEQYQRACEISERLKQLERVEKEIRGTVACRLTYMYSRRKDRDDYVPCSDYVMSYIGNLFDKHDEIIRAEIKAEIAALEQEIESL